MGQAAGFKNDQIWLKFCTLVPWANTWVFFYIFQKFREWKESIWVLFMCHWAKFGNWLISLFSDLLTGIFWICLWIVTVKLWLDFKGRYICIYVNIFEQEKYLLVCCTWYSLLTYMNIFFGSGEVDIILKTFFKAHKSFENKWRGTSTIWRKSYPQLSPK